MYFFAVSGISESYRYTGLCIYLVSGISERYRYTGVCIYLVSGISERYIYTGLCIYLQCLEFLIDIDILVYIFIWNF